MQPKQQSLDGSLVVTMPQVRTTDGHVIEWNREAIVNQLLKETGLCQ